MEKINCEFTDICKLKEKHVCNEQCSIRIPKKKCICTYEYLLNVHDGMLWGCNKCGHVKYESSSKFIVDDSKRS